MGLLFIKHIKRGIKMESIPQSVNIGLALGGATAFVFFIANLYVILHLLQKLFMPKAKIRFLENMGKKWHNIHYIGNITAIVLALTHGILMLPYASFWHWVLIILLIWMGIAGFTMRFTKAPSNVKKVLRNLHARWYMFVLVLALLIIAHIASLPNFPFPLG
jgi:hypothetical protein